MSSRVKKELLLEGLDCANCATKIEEQVKRLGEVTSASLNFVTKTLTIEVGSNGNIDEVLNLANQIIKKLEPDVMVKEKVPFKLEKKVLLLIGLDCANCAVKIKKKSKVLKV